MSKTEKFAMGKSITHRPSEKEEVWTKKSLELTVKLPEQYTDKDFQAALDTTEYLIDEWLGTTKTAPQTAPQSATQPKPLAKPSESEYIEHVRTLFPEDLEAMLTFEEKSGYVIIKPRQFLGAENFSKISSIIKSAGGEYVSAGKNSHFRVATPDAQRTKEETTPLLPEFNTEELMKHEWKGKKKDDGSYAEGSLSWGWDFVDKFSKETITVLKKGPVAIDKYEFGLNKEQTLVSAKKKKEK